jgi:hypothetical protein
VFFDKLKGLRFAIAINGDCFRLVYCKILLKSLPVLAVLLLTYVLVGVTPALASGTALDIAVVRGTDNGIYWSAYNSPGVWTSWASLSGATLSPPGICEGYYQAVYVVVRGMDDGIYLNTWTGTWSGWASPGGATIDTPACAKLNGVLYVVVRGTTSELYWNSLSSGVWSGWVDLHGASASAPVLVSSLGLSRLDLVVQGTDNGIYHKAFTGGAWSSSWDSPGGATPSKPAVVFHNEEYPIFPNCAPSCISDNRLLVVVRGTDNNVYNNSFVIGGGWGVWGSLRRQTLSAPTLAFYANNPSCSPFSINGCNTIAALAIRGTDNTVYHLTFGDLFGGGVSGWDSPGGSITNRPALAYVQGSSAQFLLLVQGYPSIYSNTVTGSSWGGYSTVGGATNSDPQLVAIV